MPETVSLKNHSVNPSLLLSWPWLGGAVVTFHCTKEIQADSLSFFFLSSTCLGQREKSKQNTWSRWLIIHHIHFSVIENNCSDLCSWSTTSTKFVAIAGCNYMRATPVAICAADMSGQTTTEFLCRSHCLTSDSLCVFQLAGYFWVCVLSYKHAES